MPGPGPGQPPPPGSSTAGARGRLGAQAARRRRGGGGVWGHPRRRRRRGRSARGRTGLLGGRPRAEPAAAVRIHSLRRQAEETRTGGRAPSAPRVFPLHARAWATRSPPRTRTIPATLGPEEPEGTRPYRSPLPLRGSLRRGRRGERLLAPPNGTKPPPRNAELGPWASSRSPRGLRSPAASPEPPRRSARPAVRELPSEVQTITPPPGRSLSRGRSPHGPGTWGLRRRARPQGRGQLARPRATFVNAQVPADPWPP
ncbi:basic proline-rich protein-like [Dama dama]|uniref:basic proline-rich protein-like n=1 Tax=Dama dama TaxID=30532 RepID=UPI002A35E56D|nr:basic proline-rich protein-like [Dama dama]